MRNLYHIAMAVLATFALASCVREVVPDNTTDVVIGKNDLAFVMSSAPVTRAADEAEVTVNNYTLKSLSEGKMLRLEETVAPLEDIVREAPATRGTPAYTENVADLYGAFNLVAYKMESPLGGSPVIADGPAEVQGDGQTWVRRFPDDPWGGNEQLYFFMRMPGTQTGVDDLSCAYEDGAGKITFNYTSPATATAQQDILFGGRPISKADRPKAGVPALFHHALTAVKFRMGNELALNPDGSVDPTKTRTYITKVEFIGLKNSGSCTVIPVQENGDYVDIKGTHSSQTAVVWDLSEAGRSTEEAPISQAFGDDDLVDYSQGEKRFPDSFYDAASADGKMGPDKNLNDEDATMTFWLIPQVLDENVTVRVTVKIVAGEDTNDGNICTLEMGRILTGTEWKAGQLRTFTIKPDVVGIKVTDEMKENNTVKENVVIKNLGNVKEYVRVNIIGNWVGQVQTAPGKFNDEYSILMGYPDDVKDGEGNYTNHTLVPTWNDKDFVWNGSTKAYQTPGYPTAGYGTFIGLPEMGTDSAPGTAVGKWIRHDKYYYYTEPIGPGDSVQPQTDPLFTKYIVGPSPAFYIADGTGTRLAARNVHLEMDVMVQAIRVPVDADGNPTEGYEAAWKRELNVENLNNL